ncbi:MAG: hypothetical protein M1819_003875 [Sarea resinae]|nr:MAG: hypothetical protein M1819_003875 [Sarea resinae]
MNNLTPDQEEEILLELLQRRRQRQQQPQQQQQQGQQQQQPQQPQQQQQQQQQPQQQQQQQPEPQPQQQQQRREQGRNNRGRPLCPTCGRGHLGECIPNYQQIARRCTRCDGFHAPPCRALCRTCGRRGHQWMYCRQDQGEDEVRGAAPQPRRRREESNARLNSNDVELERIALAREMMQAVQGVTSRPRSRSRSPVRHQARGYRAREPEQRGRQRPAPNRPANQPPQDRRPQRENRGPPPARNHPPPRNQQRPQDPVLRAGAPQQEQPDAPAQQAPAQQAPAQQDPAPAAEEIAPPVVRLAPAQQRELNRQAEAAALIALPADEDEDMFDLDEKIDFSDEERRPERDHPLR